MLASEKWQCISQSAWAQSICLQSNLIWDKWNVKISTSKGCSRQIWATRYNKEDLGLWLKVWYWGVLSVWDRRTPNWLGSRKEKSIWEYVGVAYICQHTSIQAKVHEVSCKQSMGNTFCKVKITIMYENWNWVLIVYSNILFIKISYSETLSSLKI